MGKKKQKSSSEESSSSSDSDDSSSKKTKSDRKNKAKKLDRKRSASTAESSETESKTKKTVDKVKKHKFEEAQKSKWDSPAENITRPPHDRKQEKEARPRRNSDRDAPRESRKHENYRPERRDDYRNKDNRFDNRRYNDNNNRNNDNRFNRDRGRYDKRQNNERYKPERRNSRERSRSRSRDDNRRDNRDNNRYRGNRRPFDSGADNENYEWGKKGQEDKKKPIADREKPNFGLSGKLTEDTNTFRGVVIKYSEPTEARKPKRRWRLYPFKGEKALPTLFIHRESAYLMGRDRKVVDFPLDHPSCSKQHAVLQYRLVPFTRDDGSTGKRIRPYIIDLDSANGTFINNKQIDPRKYVELLEKDVIKFGYSSREYVLLHENSKDEGLDDDVIQDEPELPVKEEPETAPEDD